MKVQLPPNLLQHCDVIKSMIEQDPDTRITAEEANSRFRMSLDGQGFQPKTELVPRTAIRAFHFDLRRPVSNSKGTRQEELTIITRSLKSDYQFQIFTLLGLGGIGKSEVVKIFLQPIQLEGTHNLIWFQGDGDSKFHQSLERLKRRLGKNDVVIEQASDLVEILPSLPTILVIDNVLELDENKNSGTLQFLRSFHLLKDGKVFILVTTRIRSISHLVGGEKLELAPLNKADAQNLIVNSLQIPELDANSVHSLCFALQNLPLAIQQATAFISQRRKEKGGNSFGIENYLKLFSSQKKKMLAYKLPIQEHEYELTTLTTWKLSFDAISNDTEYGNLASEILKIFVHLVNPDGEETSFLIPFLTMLDSVKDIPRENLFSIKSPLAEHGGKEIKSKGGPLFLRPWEQVYKTDFMPRGFGTYEYERLEKSFTTTSIILEDDESPVAGGLKLITNFCLCSIDYRSEGVDQEDIEFITMHRLVQEIIRINTLEDKDGLEWITNLYGKLIHFDFRKWTILTTSRFKKGRESSMENLWLSTPTLHDNPMIVKYFCHFCHQLWVDAYSDYLPKLQMGIWEEALKLVRNDPKIEAAEAVERYFWFSKYFQLHPPIAISEYENFYDTIDEWLSFIRKRKQNSAASKTLCENNEEILRFFLNLTEIYPDPLPHHFIVWDVVELCLRYICFDKLDPINFDLNLRKASFLKIYSLLLKHFHEYESGFVDENDKAAEVDNLMRICGHVLDLIEPLATSQKMETVQEMKQLLDFYCTRQCTKSYHRTILLQFFNPLSELDLSPSDAKLLSNVNYELYPKSATIFILENLILAPEIFSLSSRKPIALLETLLDLGYPELVSYYAAKLMESVPTLFQKKNIGMGYRIVESVHAMEKYMWELGYYLDCIKISRKILSALEYRGQFEVPDLIPGWMDDIVDRAGKLNPVTLKAIRDQLEIDRGKIEGSYNGHMLPIKSGVELGVEKDKTLDDFVVSSNTQELIATIPHNLAVIQNKTNLCTSFCSTPFTPSYINQNTSLILSSSMLESSLISKMIWGHDVSQIWELEKNEDWLESVQDYANQVGSTPLKRYCEAKVASELAKFLYSSSQEMLSTIEPKLLSWGFSFTLQFYSRLRSDQEQMVLVTKTIVNNMQQHNALEQLVKDVLQVGRNILDLRNIGSEDIDVWEDEEGYLPLSIVQISNFWHVLHTISLLERIPIFKGTLWQKLFEIDSVPKDDSLSQINLIYVLKRIQKMINSYEITCYNPIIHTICNIIETVTDVDVESQILDCLQEFFDQSSAYMNYKRLALFCHKMEITVKALCENNRESEKFVEKIKSSFSISGFYNTMLIDHTETSNEKFPDVLKLYKTILLLYWTDDAKTEIEERVEQLLLKFCEMSSDSKVWPVPGKDLFLTEKNAECLYRFLLKQPEIISKHQPLADAHIRNLIDHYTLNGSFHKLYAMGLNFSGIANEKAKDPKTVQIILDLIIKAINKACSSTALRERLQRVFYSWPKGVEGTYNLQKGTRKQFIEEVADILAQFDVIPPNLEDEEESDFSSVYENDDEFERRSLSIDV